MVPGALHGTFCRYRNHTNRLHSTICLKAVWMPHRSCRGSRNHQLRHLFPTCGRTCICLPTRYRPAFRTIELIFVGRVADSADSVAYSLLVANHTPLLLRELVKLLIVEQLFKLILIEIGQLMPFDTLVGLFIL